MNEQALRCVRAPPPCSPRCAAAGSLAVVGAQQPPARRGPEAGAAGRTDTGHAGRPCAPAAAAGRPSRPRGHAARADQGDRPGRRQLGGRQARSVDRRIRRDDRHRRCQSLGKLAFTVDQDKTKSGSDVLVIAHRMSDPVAANTYVTVIGLLMKYDQAEVAGKSKAHAATELPADAVAKYTGKPVVLATSVVNDRMLDLARFIPPPMTPEEEALQKAMRGVPAASGEMRKGADASNVEMATKNVATLTAAFTEVETFMKKRGKTDAVKWAADARANVLARREVGQERPVGRRQDRRRLGRQLLRHLPHPLPRAPRGRLVPLQGRRDRDEHDEARELTLGSAARG